MTIHVVVSYADAGTDREIYPCRTLHMKRTTRYKYNTYIHKIQIPKPRRFSTARGLATFVLFFAGTS